MKETAIPEALGAESFELEAREGWLSWVSSVDHKQLGIMYLLGAFVFFLVAGVLALLMRVQLAVPNNHFLSPEVFNQFFTMHGTTMIFLVVMPLLLGFFANFLIPLMIGARDVAFPRLNALSFWIFLFSGIFLQLGFIWHNGGLPNAGWFGYANLTERMYTPADVYNGELMNALDWNALLPPSHVPPYVIPAALALAETNRRSGKDLLVALALALEISGRVGTSLGDTGGERHRHHE